MILVTTHESADFDSAAGVLGALLLHPGAVASFPGAKASAINRHLEAHPSLLPEVRARDVDLESVRTLVLVDTVSAERIGRFKALLEAPHDVRVICYDHHPGVEPPAGAELHVTAAGAVCTLMVSALEERGITLTAEQATFLAMGIYEDTGGLLHAGTTPADLHAFASLLEQGADLSLVSRALSRGLNAEQVELYHAMLHQARHVRIRGSEVVVAALSADRFVPEASVVVQQYAQTTGATRVVAVVRMSDRIVLIVRSRASDLDASRLAARFGGGGHATAASAVIRRKTLIEVEEELQDALRETLAPSVTAEDLATPILYKVAADTRVSEAVRLLNRYRVNALPVWEKGRVVGALTRQVADMALHHGLSGRRVRDLVAAELEVVSPDEDIDGLRSRLLSGSERFVLVGQGPSRVTGIITRTALLRHLYDLQHREAPGGFVEIQPAKGEQVGEDLSGVLGRRLPEGAAAALRAVGEAAASAEAQVYLVGGVVRDLILRRENRDLDVVVEGDACRVARAAADSLGARLHVHEAFQTAALFLPDGLRLDLATARTEHYHSPGALPEVAPSGLRQDLFRRDFTINALAIRLTAPGFGRLLDFFGGRKDLGVGKIRVLHGLSFIEDPTRAFRAVRFATSLGFEIARETAHLIRVARREEVFASLSPQRLRREVERILGERRLVRAVRLMVSFQLLAVLHPELRPTRTTYRRLERAEEVLAWHRLLYRRDPVQDWAVALAVLAERLDDESRAALLDRLHPGRLPGRILRESPDGVHQVISRLGGKRSRSRSRIHEVCDGHATETLLLAMILTGREEVSRALALYLSDLRDVQPDIRGADLVGAGVPEGPKVALGLRAALVAKLDGLAPGREAQLAAAMAAIERA